MLFQNCTSPSLLPFHFSQPQLVPIPDTNYGFYKQKKLGEGYGGVIFEGRRINDSYPVAIKIVNINSLLQNHIPLQELVDLTSKGQTKQSGSELMQNGLVRVFDVIQMDKTLIIMQLCKFNLSEFVLCQKLLTQCQILTILQSVIHALITVEKHGYHFADIKPQNILITHDGKAKLGDLESLVMLHKLNKNVQLKFHHSIFGTLSYMPPELIGLGEHSDKNYIWSLGVIMHEIIYGRPPFQLVVHPQNSTEKQKLQSLNAFYQNLFNFKICVTRTRDFPKCHILLKKMLRFNAKNRICLEKIIQIIQTQTQANLLIQKLQQTLQTKRTRSNSENTIDTADEYKKQLKDCSINWRSKKSNNLNQKQIGPAQIQPQRTHFSNKSHLSIHEFYLSLKEAYEQKTTKLIACIESPLILVKKLNNFKQKMANLLQKCQNTRQDTESQDHQTIVKSIWEEIRTSKAYGHLQTTIKIYNLRIQFERNHREVALWNHLNQVIQMAQIQMISLGRMK